MAYLRRFKRLPNRLKVTYLLISLMVLLSIGVFIRAALTGKMSPKAEGESASMYLINPPMVDVGQIVDVDIFVNSNASVDTIAVRSLNYNSALLDSIDQDSGIDGIQIKPQSIGDFSILENNVDQGSGKVTFVLQNSGSQVNDLSAGTRIATAKFLTKSAGVNEFNFDFTPGLSGDCDVIINPPGGGGPVDILSSASRSNLTIISPTAVPTPTSTYFPPEETPEPTQVPTQNPTPQESITPGPVSSSEGNNPPPTAIALVTPGPNISITPTPLIIETSEPTPAPEIEIAGIGISKTMALILFIGIPILLTAIAYFIWWWLKQKKGGFKTDKKDSDDDDLI
ncbi:MAG: hypothetical protein HW405_823 [Candidatus Berkelbacteria bacterium]|nr:hypothetical protein [Candidatus Berkelbacteria bacterium]